MYKLFLQETCAKFWLNSYHFIYDEPPFVFAAKQGHKLVFQLLLDTLNQEKDYVDINMSEKASSLTMDTALSAACCNGDLEMVEKLLRTLDYEDPQKRVNVNKMSHGGHVISSAVVNGRFDVVKLLLNKAGNIIRLANSEKIFSIEYVCRKGNVDNLKFLLSALNIESNFFENNFQPICAAIGNDDHGGEIIKELLKYPHVDINRVSENELSPLMEACYAGKTESVRILLQTSNNESKKIDFNIQDYEFNTALHIACQRGHVNIVKLLLDTLELEDLDRRVNIDLKNLWGQTPLDVAKSQNQQEIVQLFNDCVRN